jgi:hypothetical protein
VKRGFVVAFVAIASLLAIGASTLVLTLSARADDGYAIGDIVPCNTGHGIIPEGSMCQVESNNTWRLVLLGPELPLCERAHPPPEALPETCKILDTEEGGGFGTSALLSFETREGGELKIWILPGGKQYGPWLTPN